MCEKRESIMKTYGSKQEILKVAERNFKKHGYDATTFQMIAKELRITPGTITYHFKNKHWILHQLFREFFLKLSDYINKNVVNDFNYYVYYCVFYIYVYRVVLKSENSQKLFEIESLDPAFKKINADTNEKLFRLITNDYKKGFSKDDVHLAAVMYSGARASLVQEYNEADGGITIDDWCFHHSRLIGILSGLDEAAIQKNVRRAFDFANSHIPPSIYLLE